jgi:hypothetical protein
MFQFATWPVCGLKGLDHDEGLIQGERPGSWQKSDSGRKAWIMTEQSKTHIQEPQKFSSG